MAGTIRVSGFGNSMVIRLSQGNRITFGSATQGGVGETIHAAVTAAVLAMRAENGGTVGAGVAMLKDRGWQVLCQDVDLDLTAEDIEQSGGLTSDLAAELVAWRGDLGITQVEAANLLPVSIRTYQGWEMGRPAPAFLRGSMRDARRRHIEGRPS